MEILISKDRQYLYLNGMISNLDTKTVLKTSDISINETIDFFKNQSLKLIN